MIEVKNVGLDIVRSLYQVSYDAPILGYLVGDTEGTVKI
jgi:hypothetical protein